MVKIITKLAAAAQFKFAILLKIDQVNLGEIIGKKKPAAAIIIKLPTACQPNSASADALPRLGEMQDGCWHEFTRLAAWIPPAPLPPPTAAALHPSGSLPADLRVGCRRS